MLPCSHNHTVRILRNRPARNTGGARTPLLACVLPLLYLVKLLLTKGLAPKMVIEIAAQQLKRFRFGLVATRIGSRLIGLCLCCHASTQAHIVAYRFQLKSHKGHLRCTVGSVVHMDSMTLFLLFWPTFHLSVWGPDRSLSSS